MPLSQKGAGYEDRNYIKDPHTLRALDDIASQIQSVAKLTNTGKQGATPAPAPPTSVAVSASQGFGYVTVSNPNAPQGVAYQIQYSASPGFTSPVTVDNGIQPTWSQYLKGQTLYFRVATTFYSSPQSAWVYFGSASNPTPVTF